MKKSFIFINCFILLLSLFTNVAFAQSNSTVYDIKAPEYESEIALLVNVDTDTVIYSKNADKITAPASLTKIVTALVALEKGDPISKKITCSKKAVDSILGTGSSIAGLYAGEKTTLEMLLYCLFLVSGNDAAAVLAEHYGEGDEQKFVNEMNEYVKKLGCKNTYFANPHGLDDESTKGFESDKQSRTTANDMYIIAKHALKNETIKKISSKYGKTMPKTNKSDIRYLYNTNPLLNDYSYYYYPGAIGLKTGTTDKAGACLISSATKNGYTYISIAMKGVTNYYLDGEGRNTAYLTCRYMLKWAFQNMEM
ncbi:MAG: D-alanyl-D-alanine carboxypeptidase, partial [Clostridia bacterium]|nr:D-alanyl-D-alanine carboxypeptidase [Clostridia bacterium]